MKLLSIRLFAAIAAVGASAALPITPFGQSQEPAAANVSKQPTDRGATAFAADLEATVKPGKRWALLVGINKYIYANELHYCGRDVDVLRNALVQHGGYLPEHVHVLSDVPEGSRRLSPSHSAIVSEFYSFLKLANPEDTVLFAFCGHGKLAEEGPNKDKSYLVPIDGNEELLEQTAISVASLHKMLEAYCPARQKIVILDACHAAGKRGGEGFDPKDVKPGKGTIELLSCNAKQTSQEDDGLQQGVFSYFLAQAIQGSADLRPNGNEDGLVSFDETYRYIHREVERHTRGRQSPVRRVEAEGELTLAVRSSNSQDTVLEDRLLLKTLKERGAHGKTSPELQASLAEWLKADENTAWGRDMRLAASLLARDFISEPEFLQLTRLYRPQLTSHVDAQSNSENRAIRLIAVGVNTYPEKNKRWNLQGPKHDVELLADIIKKGGGPIKKDHGPDAKKDGGPEIDVTVLLDRQATSNAVREAISRAAQKSKRGDLLMITFSGQGLAGDQNEQGDTTRSGGWLLYDADFDAAEAAVNPNRGGLRPLLGRVAGVLAPQAVVELIQNTAADVVVVSDSSCLMNEWPAPLSFVNQPDPSRLWIGTSSSREATIDGISLNNGDLSFLIAQGLLGQADRASSAVDYGQKKDGFVTANDLAAFLAEHAQAESRTGRKRSLQLRGVLKNHAVLTRSTLPVD